MGMMQMESSMAMLALMGDEGPAGQAKKIYFGVLDSVESVSLVKAFFADLVLEITFPNLALTALFPDRETLDQMVRRPFFLCVCAWGGVGWWVWLLVCGCGC